MNMIVVAAALVEARPLVLYVTPGPLRLAPCRCCGQRPGYRPRGLCSPCYDAPGVRERFPSTSPYARRGPGVVRGKRPLPDAPTMHPPGSPGKMAILAERAALGVQLWHPDDAPLIGDDAYDVRPDEAGE